MTSREFSDRVRRRARKADVQLSDALLEQLEAYFRLLGAWNAKINLTALDLERDPDKAVDRLLIEPLVAVKHLGPGDRGGDRHRVWRRIAGDSDEAGVPGGRVHAGGGEDAGSARSSGRPGRQLGIDLRVETARFEVLLTRPEFHEAFDVVHDAGGPGRTEGAARASRRF